jgi:tRNA(Ile)-lysidine synthase|tara:strand:+ start:426 stop:563 length:138 start_codon:yes stop_codon:yes gene_type:complete
MINIIKGSGISGFHGILYKNKKIIRPIMCLNKKMIIEYAKKKKLK